MPARSFILVLALVVAGGCPRREPPTSERPDAAAGAARPADVGPGTATAAGIAAADDPVADAAPVARPVVSPPAGGFHLDGDGFDEPRPGASGRARRGPPIAITLRSTPAGAVVSVDGEAVGRTPAYWEGMANGQPHEFTFVLPGYALVRYRFVPTTDGVVHGRLQRLAQPPADAP